MDNIHFFLYFFIVFFLFSKYILEKKKMKIADFDEFFYFAKL